ncbi:MAG: RtcB family protein, partial [Candidatus Bathyarchaeota archaeon]|nr:RtcB family protein [Candidatus Bathyarchaeota archaeon]
QEEVWMHRHNSCRVVPGQFCLLPGYNNTSSYLCVGGEATTNSLNSVPHGAGALISRFWKEGLLKELPHRRTLLFRGKASEAESVGHYCDTALDRMANSLAKDKLLKPVVRLTPLAVLKDFR